MIYKSFEELAEHCAKMDYDIGFSGNVSAFSQKKRAGRFTFENSVAVLPMEGCDADYKGAPSDLTYRRYERFAQGGASLIWVEATAVVPEGRNSPRQLYINDVNAPAFARFVSGIKKRGKEENGFEPVLVLQLTHSGRYSKPEGAPKPVLAAHNPLLDEKFRIESDRELITDGELDKLGEAFSDAVMLAKKAGFDGVDIKACHGYLVSELLSSFTREGKYGGDFEGRTRFIRNVVQNAREQAGREYLIASRFNVFDAMPYPYGWGVSSTDGLSCNLSEPVRLLRELNALGLDMVGITLGNPYFEPHYNRPFDGKEPPEPPLKSVERHMNLTYEIKRALPELTVLGAGYTYLGSFAAQAGAFILEQQRADIIGFGRQAFAYPQFARDLIEKGSLDNKNICVTCGKCSELMRGGAPAGCVVRDKVYTEMYSNLKRREKDV